MASRRTELLLGLGIAAFSVVTLTLWIPSDIDSGIIETVRRREKMGDALFPTAVALAMLAVGAVHVVLALRDAVGRADARTSDTPSLPYLWRLLAVLGLGLGLMHVAGPALVHGLAAAGADIASYRELRDTAPWKYVGFAAGGFALVFLLITLIEGRPRWRTALVAGITVAALIGLYDLPFDDLLLPPNGDW